MELVSTSTIAGYLAKLGAGVATAQLKAILANGSKRRRISKKVSRAAEKEGIKVRPAVLREWLERSDVREQLLVGRTQSIESAVDRLAWALTGPEAERKDDALRLVEITCHQYLLVQSPQEATAIASAQLQAKASAEHEATRAVVSSEIAALGTLVGRLDSSAVFDEDLRRLHSWRAVEARELASTWPATRDLVHLIALSHDRGSLFGSWAIDLPSILGDAPGSVLCWVGQLAKDYARPSVAVEFMVRGIELGVSDPDYWWARTALAQPIADDGIEQATRDLLARAHAQHPLGVAQLAILERDWASAEQALVGWQPTSDTDQSTKALLLAESVRAQDRLDEAISILEAGCKTAPDGSGPRLHLAELLLSRGYRGLTVSRIADFAMAKTHAIRARDSRRQWGGDSTAAALVAVKASALASDLDETWRLTRNAPEGEATTAEAADPRLQREAAILAAMSMRNEAALALVADLSDPYTTAVVAGYQAMNADELSIAEERWLEAWTHASDVFTQLQVARSLAPLGLRMPDLDDLAADQPDMVAEIHAIHAVMASSSGERRTRLRANCHESEQIAVLLAEDLSAEGDHLGAGEVLEEAAKRWDIPLLMKMAAERYFRAGKYQRSVDACHHAYTMAGADWSGEFECRVIEFEALESLGREDQSILVARRMTALAPDNDDARWALVQCLGRDGNLDAAFAALRHNGRPIRPRTREEARNWVVILTEADQSPHYLPRVLDELVRWIEDEEVAGVFLANVTLGLSQRDTAPDEAQLSRLHASTEEYVDRFPDSPVFRRFNFSETDPLGELSDVLRAMQTDPAVLELHEQIANAKLPVGLASELHNVSYAEVVIKRAAGFAYSHAPGAPPSDLELLLKEIDSGPCVLDTTAGVSLLSLDPHLRSTLVGRFARLESTGAAFRDARSAQRSLGTRSTLKVGWDPTNDRPRVTEISTEDAEALAARAAALVDLLTMTTRREWHLQHFTSLEMQGAWLSAIDYAVSSGTPLWCDDLLLRSLAKQAGCVAFGTVELIQALENSGVIASQLALSGQAALLQEFHAVIDFDADVYELASESDDWRAGGAALALSLPELWQQPQEALSFLHRATEHNASASPDDLRAWVGAASVGLCKLASLDEVGASRNLSVLLGSFIAQPWITPRLFPIVVEGIRQAIGLYPGLRDPLHDMLVLMHTLASEAHNDSAAAYILLHWAEYLERPDKHDATMIAIHGRG